MRDDLAPAGGSFGKSDCDRAVQVLANERSRINTDCYRQAGMQRSHRAVDSFLRRLATHPERLRRGNYHGLDLKSEIEHLFDHIRLYNRNGRPYAAIFHPYSRLDRDTLKTLLDWALDAGLDVCVDADSEYYPGVTLRLALYREGEKFPITNLT